MSDDLKTFATRLYGDYHTHTVYSHGKGTIEENVKRAEELGLLEIAITDHSFSHFICGASKKGFLEQRHIIDNLRNSSEVKVLLGIEANLQGISGKIDVSPSELEKMDILLCGFHKPVFAEKFSDYFTLFANSYLKYLFRPTKKMIARNTLAYINAIRKNPIDIVTHINYHIAVDCGAVAAECAKYGTFIELSSRHLDCTKQDIEAMLATDVGFIINSDAHKIAKIADCDFAFQIMEKYGIPSERVQNIDGKKPQFRLQRERAKA